MNIQPGRCVTGDAKILPLWHEVCNASGAEPSAHLLGAVDMSKSDWSNLMAAAQTGSAEAYHLLLKEIRAWLRRYYSRRLPASMIEDAVQEALIAVHKKRHTYDPSRAFGPWLAAIARYKWIDCLRAMTKASSHLIYEDIASQDEVGIAADTFELEQLLATLKPAQSEVIRCVKLCGFSIVEAASLTGQSTSLVKVNIHRGLRRLAHLVQGRPGTERHCPPA
jgi:RNA polymerase sigma factor (sigma-70 family)